MYDQPIILEVGQSKPDNAIIWLHGLGADGHDFEGLVPELSLSETFNIRFVFPHAAMMPVTINQGFVMRAWYDITSADFYSDQDESGIRKSQAYVDSLIEQQINQGIKPEKIILAGFSQGGVIALQSSLRSRHKLAGVMALSTYLALDQTLKEEKTQANQHIPILLAHGTADPVINIKWAYQTYSQLIGEGYQIDWNEYAGMQHGLCREEIVDIHRFIFKVLRFHP